MVARPDRRKAITLIELLVVFSIIAIISGMGLGLWSHSGRHIGFQAIRGEINSLIQLTQSNARIDNREITLAFDPARKEAYYISKRTFGMWHFEDIDMDNATTSGAFNRNAKLGGASAIVTKGLFGNCLALTVTSASWVEIDRIPLLNKAEGLMIECSIYPYPVLTPTDQTIIRKEGEYTVALRVGNSISVNFGEATISTTWNSIPYDRWSNLKLTYEPDTYGAGQQSSGTVALFLNNKKIDELANVAKPQSGDAPVIIGSQQEGESFSGVLDEFKFSGLIKTDPVKLEPADMTVMLIEQGGTQTNITEPLYVVYNHDGFLSMVYNKSGFATTAPVMLSFASKTLRDTFDIAIK
jgi:type II secretory pathway pseudopilin PulG